MSKALISIEGLRLEAGGKLLVNDASIEINKGSVVGLVGESGSGKTLTALSVLRLLPPNVTLTSGKILMSLENRDLLLHSETEKELNRIRGRQISMIFQEPMTSLNPSIRCGLQVIEPMLKHLDMNKKEAREKAMALFEEVKLPHAERIYKAWPHELSGGQRQRVMIAQALSTSPALLIADEPTTALDVTVQKSILDLLMGLKEKYSLSILFISHDLMVVRNIADRIAVMYRGKIVESGNTEEVMTKPSSPYTRALIACKPRLDEHPRRLPTVSTFMDVDHLKNVKKISQSPSPVGQNEPPLLKVENLVVSYPGKRRHDDVVAVNKVSFEVSRGESLGLVGESGCGKTSLGRAILKLIDEKSGSVIYKSKRINQLSEKSFRTFRKELQIVFQDPYSSLNPRKTIGNILAEPLRIHGIIKGKKALHAECVRLLEQVELPAESINLYPHQFSGGQRQRIGIARALACRPEFILLDESVSALDVSVQAQIINLLNDLKDEYQLTYLFISHDLTVVKYFSDRILVMSDGEIVESGDAEQIYLNPLKNYTRQLIQSIPG